MPIDAAQLDSLAERAQRQLDGMSINRDAFARDVLRLVAQVRRQARQDTNGRHAETPPQGGYASAFDDIFSGIFGNKDQRA